MMGVKVKAKRGKQGEIIARVKASECLACGGSGKMRRGLCVRCYIKLRRRLARAPEAERMELEQRAISQGLLLEVQQVREIRGDDPFADL
jgi:hypothetical protein